MSAGVLLTDLQLVRAARNHYRREHTGMRPLSVSLDRSTVERAPDRTIVTLREGDGSIVTRYEARIGAAGLRFIVTPREGGRR